MRNRFENQLSQLNEELTRMGALCERVLSLSAKALVDGDTELAREVFPVDAEIDRAEHEIETLCLRLLLQQQPVAGDLRQISAALKMITDMERIGDQASDIADIIACLGGRTVDDCAYIAEMSRAVIKMVNNSVDAYIKRDLALACAVIEHDDVVDELFVKVKASLTALIARAPDEGEYFIDLLMIAKYFERIGDHATNIAEWVVFSVTGVHKGVEAL